eukprot:jgi/Mesvir1/15487/Mv25875-RA.1
MTVIRGVGTRARASTAHRASQRTESKALMKSTKIKIAGNSPGCRRAISSKRRRATKISGHDGVAPRTEAHLTFPKVTVESRTKAVEDHAHEQLKCGALDAHSSVVGGVVRGTFVFVQHNTVAVLPLRNRRRVGKQDPVADVKQEPRERRQLNHRGWELVRSNGGIEAELLGGGAQLELGEAAGARWGRPGVPSGLGTCSPAQWRAAWAAQGRPQVLLPGVRPPEGQAAEAAGRRAAGTGRNTTGRAAAAVSQPESVRGAGCAPPAGRWA